MPDVYPLFLFSVYLCNALHIVRLTDHCNVVLFCNVVLSCNVILSYKVIKSCNVIQIATLYKVVTNNMVSDGST